MTKDELNALIAATDEGKIIVAKAKLAKVADADLTFGHVYSPLNGGAPSA